MIFLRGWGYMYSLECISKFIKYVIKENHEVVAAGMGFKLLPPPLPYL